ncbi:MAG: glycosyltransferase [Solirubrobacterales bacterium]
MTRRATDLAYLTDEWGSNPLSRIEGALFAACLRAGLSLDAVYTDDATPETEQGTCRRISLGSVRAAWATPRLVRYFRAARPKAAIVKSGQLGPATVLAGLITRTPVVVWEPTITDFEVASVGPRMRLMFFLQRLLYRKATALAGASRDVVKWAGAHRGVPPERLFLWPNAVDIEAIRRLSGDQGPQPEPPLRFIAIGRLVEQKGYDILIEALALADPDLPEWRLEILGVEGVWKGKWKARIEEMVHDHGLEKKVRLVGQIDDPSAFFPMLKRSSLFLHSARWEAFGSVIVEAMACGTPVILTDCPGGPKEILEGGRFGRLVANEDPQAFASALVALASDPAERARLGESGSQRAEDYSADRHLPKMLADIERVSGVRFSLRRCAAKKL